MNSTDVKVDIECKKRLAEDSDYKNIPNNKLTDMAFQIFLIREFEQALLKLSRDGCIHGPVHTSIGEESCAVGAMAALKDTDKIASTHRAHHHYLAKIFNHYLPSEFNIFEDDLPQVISDEARTLMGEIMGLSIGCCGGRGGSMHLRNEKIGVIGTNAIVAGGVPLATGAAFSAKYRKTDDVIVCFLGDGAVNQGAFHEAVNLAGVWKLPIIYFIENNLYAVGTSIKNSTATDGLAVKAAAYGIFGMIVDGMNPIAVEKATKEAVDYVRGGNGAIILESKCYRFPHHAGPIDGSSFGYRTKEEEKKWRQLDAYQVFPNRLIEDNVLIEEQVEQLKEKAVNFVSSIAQNCAGIKDGKFLIKQQLLPKVKTVETGLRSDRSEFKNIKFVEKGDFCEFEQIPYNDSIAAVTGRWLEKDKDVFVVGEEIASFGQGTYGATKGLPAKYPDRVLNTPISEAGFCGLAGGAAMSGMKPIVEIMFPDFALVAADQLFNQIGRLRHIYGNTTDMQLVVRTRIAIGCGYGGQHSMDPAGLYSLFSGWTITAPSNAFDYIGLFNTAMISKDPILMIEHHEIYTEKFDIPKNNLDYCIPFGKANILKQGSDVTVVSYSMMTRECLKAIEKLQQQEINSELIDLRTISPADIDYKTIGNSLKKTGTLVIVEQAPQNQSLGARIAEKCQRRFFDYLDGPIVTISSLDIPNPVSKTLEQAVVPSSDQIEKTILKAAKRQFL